MRVFEARWDHLGAGEAPWSPHGEVLDVLDVADLESEAQHRYELLGASDGEQVAEEGNAPDGRVVVDGGRTQRSHERFVMRLPPGQKATLIARVQTMAQSKLELRAGERYAGTNVVEPGSWVEVSFELPPGGDALRDATVIEMTASGSPVTAFHWWVTAR